MDVLRAPIRTPVRVAAQGAWLWPRHLLWLIAFLLVPANTRPALAQPTAADAKAQPTAGEPVPQSGWQLESVLLTDGRRLQGLIRSHDQAEIELVEVVRPQGKPMYLVVRPVATALVDRVERLPEPRRVELAQRIDQFRNRARIEAGRMQDVSLRHVTDGNTAYLEYEGSWFRLRSTTEEDVTRRSIIRIEQMFRAYRQLLPPRQSPRSDRPLQVMLFGSVDEYRNYPLEGLGIALHNPAFYSSARNVIAAGSELTRFAERWQAVRRQSAETLHKCEELEAALPGRLERLATQLKRQGLARAPIRAEVAAQRRAWQEKRESILRGVREAERRNAALFADVTEAMFRRLYHEAFHAYLENYLYPSGQYQVPVWFNEGLAQVFEAAQLDGDTLRVDAPPRERLRRLQADLQSDEPLRLQELLDSNQNRFLITHTPSGSRSQRHYDYSWGLAYFLMFGDGTAGQPVLDDYVSRAAAELPPDVRFERFVDTSLGKFEKDWRQSILALKPSAR